MKLIGCDVFLYWTQPNIPELPKTVGPLRLELIANRATKVWPTSAAKLDYFAEEWRARYTSENDQPVNQAEIAALLKQLSDQGKFWTRVQVLQLLPDGTRGFSQPY
jgi:hypothetical protein